MRWLRAILVPVIPWLCGSAPLVALAEVAHLEYRVQTGHSGLITAISYSRDGGLLATAAGDRTIRIWHTATGRLLRVLPTDCGRHIAFYPGGNTLISAENCQGTPRLRRWNVKTGEELPSFPLEKHADLRTSLEVSRDGRYVLFTETSGVVIFDAETGKRVRTLTDGDIKSAHSAAFMSDSTTVITGAKSSPWYHFQCDHCHPPSLTKWDLRDGHRIGSFGDLNDEIADWDISPDGNYVLATTLDRRVVLSLESGAIVSTLRPPDEDYRKNPQGAEFAFSTATRMSSHALFGPDSKTIILSLHGKIGLWDAITGNFQRWILDQVFTPPIDIFALSPSGAEVTTGKTSPFRVPLFDAANAPSGYYSQVPADSNASVLLSQNGARAVRFFPAPFPDQNATWVTVWNAEAGQPIGKPLRVTGLSRLAEDRLAGAALSPDMSLLAIKEDGTIAVWQLDSGVPKRLALPGSATEPSFSFSADSTTLTAEFVDGEKEVAAIFDLRAEDPVARIVACPESSCVPPQNAIRRDSEGGGLIIEVRGAAPIVEKDCDPLTTAKAISARGRYAVSMCPYGLWGYDGYINGYSARISLRALPNMAARTLTCGDERRGDRIKRFVFSHDEALLAGILDDGAVCVWSTGDGTLLNTLRWDEARVVGARFSPDSRVLTLAAADGSIRFVDAGIRSLAEKAAGNLLLATNFAGISLSDADAKLWWLTITPAGFYAGSDDAARFVAITRKKRTFGLGQVRENLFRQDLVIDNLRGDPARRYDQAAKAITLEEALLSGAPPQIKHRGGRWIDDRRFEVELELFNNAGGGIGSELEWRVGGRLQGSSRPLELQTLRDRNETVIVKQVLVADPTKDTDVTVVAWNRTPEGRELLASEPYKIVVRKDLGFTSASHPQARMFIIGVAVEGYKPPLHPLRYPIDDTQALVASLTEVGTAGGYSVPAPMILTEQEATRDGISRAFSSILAQNPRDIDTLVVILSGHGQSVDGRYYYYPYDADLLQGNTLKQGISADEWKQWIGSIQVSKRLIIIDTCESSDGIAVTRSASDDISRETAIDRISAALGETVFTAARQVAYEGSALGHGVLTYALLEGMKSADPASPGTQLWTKELDNYVVRRVPDLSKSLGREQQPHNKLTSDFPLGLRVAGINLAEMPAASAMLPGEFYMTSDQDLLNDPSEKKTVARIARSTKVLKLKGERDGYVRIIRDSQSGWVERTSVEMLK